MLIDALVASLPMIHSHYSQISPLALRATRASLSPPSLPDVAAARRRPRRRAPGTQTRPHLGILQSSRHAFWVGGALGGWFLVGASLGSFIEALRVVECWVPGSAAQELSGLGKFRVCSSRVAEQIVRRRLRLIDDHRTLGDSVRYEQHPERTMTAANIHHLASGESEKMIWCVPPRLLHVST